MKSESDTRNYHQTARAKAAEETGERILDAFRTRIGHEWFDDLRLDDVAADAGVTVQTVIRRFGGKEGLLDAAGKRMEAEIILDRQLPVGDAWRAVGQVVSEYERHGDVVVRMLGQEDRHPAIRSLTDAGRVHHRTWIGDVFAPWLDRLDPAMRLYTHDRLVVATDLYVWKLVRRDMGRSRETVCQMMFEFCASALDLAPQDLLQDRHSAPETTDA